MSSISDRIKERRNQDWVLTNNPPKGHGNKMYYFEFGDKYGVKGDNDKIYYRLNCSYWFGDWIETNSSELWKTYGGYHRAIYIVREELMLLIKLRWS